VVNRYKKYKPPFDDRNRAGERICVMCGKPLDGRKRRWCGNSKCWQLVELRSGNQDAMRRYLLARDKGICAGCGLNLETIRELGDILQDRYEWSQIQKPKNVLKRVWHKCCQSWGYWSRAEWKEFLKELDIDPGCHMHYWEADHIIPFAKGGKHHENNLQILCLNCHHKKARKIKKATQGKLFGGLRYENAN